MSRFAWFLHRLERSPATFQFLLRHVNRSRSKHFSKSKYLKIPE
nr:MAG TPA: hypothetical protein [Caudoviricetes sp.]